MGTNYYLIKKCSKEELSKYGHYNDDFRSDSEPKRLTNGFIYRNTYYPAEEELLKRASEILSVYEAKDTKNKKVEQVSFFDEEEAPKEQKPKVKTEIQYINSEVEEELKNINVDNFNNF